MTDDTTINGMATDGAKTDIAKDNEDSHGKVGSNKAAIAGAVVGGLIGFILLVFGAYKARQHSKSKKIKEIEALDDQIDTPPEDQYDNENTQGRIQQDNTSTSGKIAGNETAEYGVIGVRHEVAEIKGVSEIEGRNRIQHFTETMGVPRDSTGSEQVGVDDNGIVHRRPEHAVQYLAGVPLYVETEEQVSPIETGVHGRGTRYIETSILKSG